MSEVISQAPVAVSIKDVTILFGDNPKAALPMLEKGASREEIQEQTSQILGVANADLDVREGEIIVLMGLSGSGKSTLLRGINGLNPVTCGSIEVTTAKGMVDVADCSKSALRALRTESVAMVFQQFGLLPWRTVRDNVGFGLELSGVKKAERNRQVDKQLELVGLEQWADKMVQELSGGMQQRVGLARAFATGAPILLMDEPYSALDPLIRAHLQDELLALQKKLGCTIVFVSHDLDEAIKIGNRIAIMEGGRIIQVGTPQDIILNPADQYVADFVAHMNPMQVLRAAEIMRPLSDIAVEIVKGQDADCIVWHERNRKIVPLESLLEDEDSSWDEGEEEIDIPEEAILAVPKTTSMKTLLALRLHANWPFLVQDECGKAVGLIDEEDIYQALIR